MATFPAILVYELLWLKINFPEKGVHGEDKANEQEAERPSSVGVM